MLKSKSICISIDYIWLVFVVYGSLGASKYIYKMIKVTPCVGVWIETWFHEATFGQRMSHPAWVCGLKL